MKSVIVAMMAVMLALPAFGKTHRDVFPVPCSELWPAVKDALRNSGKYGIIGIDNTEMTASYNIGGGLAGKRINSVVLNSQGSRCEMQTQTAYSGVVHNDAADFKKRVEESLAKLKGTKPSEPAKPEAAPAATPAPAPPSAPEAAPQPAPAAPAPEELATIVVKSIPDGADITVDGKFVGSTPSTVRLPPGDHTVVLQKSGYKTWQRTLAVSLGNTITVGPALEKNAE